MGYENRWDGEEIASRVRSVISDVMESLELGRWNQTVKDTAGSVLEEARKQMEQCRRKVGDAKWRGQTVGQECEAPQSATRPLEIRVNWKGKVSGVLLTVFGGIGSVAFGLPALGILAAMTTSFHNPIGWWIAGCSGAAALGFGGMLWTGISQNRRIGRLKRYVEELKRHGKSYCEIEELSRNCVRSPGFVRKDLKRIMGLGMLPDVRMDKKGSWLLLDDETYRQFQLFEKSQKEAEGSEERKGWFKSIKDRKSLDKHNRQKQNTGQADSGGTGPAKENVNESSTIQEERTPLEAAIWQGEQYMAALRQLRDFMPNDPVDEKLKRLETVLVHLFTTLKKHPEQLDEMERFMEYYLPTTVKLAESYREFAAVEFPGENIRQAMKEILQTFDIINGAFEKLQDNLYRDAVFDVMTDASVLQTMLARDGMTEDDFKRNS